MPQKQGISEEILQACYHSTPLFCRTFFSDRFYTPFNDLHEQIFDLIDARDSKGRPAYRKIAIAAPRGLGKTSILAMGYVAKAIAYRDHAFAVVISQSATAAIMQTENLKRELLGNKLFTHAFNQGHSIKPEKGEFEESFSKDTWVAKLRCKEPGYYGTMILPRGSGQQIRGVLFGSARPSLLIFDDLEDKETINNEDIRADRKRWFFGDAMKTIDRYSPDNYQALYIDTVKHEDCLLLSLMESSDWETLNLSACDETYKTLAPSYMTQVDLDKLIKVARDEGTLDVFAMEYMNEPISREKASFKQEYFKYYDEGTEGLQKNKNVENVVLLDPAKSQSEHGARSAMVCWGVNTMTGNLYIRDIVEGMFAPDNMYAELFSMALRNNAQVIGYEITGLNEFITYPLEDAMLRAGYRFELVPLQARQGSGEYSGRGKGKVGRIAALVPYYRKGLIYHNGSCTAALEQQLLSYPKSKRWDIMDAAAYIVEMLAKGERFYCPFFQGNGESLVKAGERSTPEAEYLELEKQYEPALNDAWMIV